MQHPSTGRFGFKHVFGILPSSIFKQFDDGAKKQICTETLEEDNLEKIEQKTSVQLDEVMSNEDYQMEENESISNNSMGSDESELLSEAIDETIEVGTILSLKVNNSAKSQEITGEELYEKVMPLAAAVLK